MITGKALLSFLKIPSSSVDLSVQFFTSVLLAYATQIVHMMQ